MKTSITIAALVFVTNIACAQKVKESEVPKAVIESFNKNFKGLKAEKWEKEKDGAYEAEFDVKKMETSASFSPDGELLNTETEIKISGLPKPVSDYVTQNYSTYKIGEASKIVDSKGAVSYEAEVKKGKEEFDLLFDSNGIFLKKEVEGKDEKD